MHFCLFLCFRSLSPAFRSACPSVSFASLSLRSISRKIFFSLLFLLFGLHSCLVIDASAAITSVPSVCMFLSHILCVAWIIILVCFVSLNSFCSYGDYIFALVWCPFRIEPRLSGILGKSSGYIFSFFLRALVV